MTSNENIEHQEYSKPPHLYCLVKVHKQNYPLRPIVSSKDSRCQRLAKYLENKYTKKIIM
jgi:hypothetical protein